MQTTRPGGATAGPLHRGRPVTAGSAKCAAPAGLAALAQPGARALRAGGVAGPVFADTERGGGHPSAVDFAGCRLGGGRFAAARMGRALKRSDGLAADIT
jgi:hypothetical protein